MGPTGIVLRAAIQMTKTETAYFVTDHDRTQSLEETVAFFSDGSDAEYDYSAAWFDVMSKGARLGRAVIGRASLAKPDELPRKLRADPLEFDAPQLMTAPDVFPGGVAMNRLSFLALGEFAPTSRRGSRNTGSSSPSARRRNSATWSDTSRVPDDTPPSTSSNVSAPATARRCRSRLRAVAYSVISVGRDLYTPRDEIRSASSHPAHPLSGVQP
ncbi:hypothetical protein [Embleya scabrispora]|uniref:hypothetical protein n=1 Tax=Embleya scabrispora TaxID=159449 RepID=UPI0026841A9A|nr:hypothetical protein [Embleya scabrispora]